MAQDDEFRALLGSRIAAYRSEEAQLERRIAEWQVQKASVSERREQAEALYEAEFGNSPGSEELDELSLFAVVDHHSGPYSGASWADAIAAVLRESDGPLHIKAIWDGLQAGGFRSDSRDPLRSLVSVMVRRPEFVKVAPNTYGLASPAREPARGGAA